MSTKIDKEVSESNKYVLSVNEPLQRLRTRLTEVLEHDRLFMSYIYDPYSHSIEGIYHRKLFLIAFAKVLGVDDDPEICRLKSFTGKDLQIVEMNIPNKSTMRGQELSDYLTNISTCTNLLGVQHNFTSAAVVCQHMRVYCHFLLCALLIPICSACFTGASLIEVKSTMVFCGEG